METRIYFIFYIITTTYTEFYATLRSIYFTNFSKHACTQGARIKQFYLLERYETRNANVWPRLFVIVKFP